MNPIPVTLHIAVTIDGQPWGQFLTVDAAKPMEAAGVLQSVLAAIRHRVRNPSALRPVAPLTPTPS